jgi:hypothetical protein
MSALQAAISLQVSLKGASTLIGRVNFPELRQINGHALSIAIFRGTSSSTFELQTWPHQFDLEKKVSTFSRSHS